MADLMWMYALTPLHPGSGTRVSYVDLPVQRERTTGFPIVQASSVKGVLRWEAVRRIASRKDDRETYVNKVAALFGPGQDLKAFDGPTEASDFAGAVVVSDARLLLFPVRSLAGVFAWVTAPVVIRRWVRDLQMCVRNDPELQEKLRNWAQLEVQRFDTIGVSADTALRLPENDRVVLEDLTLDVHEAQADTLTSLAEFLREQLHPDNTLRDLLPRHIALVHDDVFTEFVQSATEVVHRVRIEHVTGTVAEGALWTEELVPAESLFWVIVDVQPPKNHALNGVNAETLRQLLREVAPSGCILQFGGDETLGRGLVQITWSMSLYEQGG